MLLLLYSVSKSVHRSAIEQGKYGAADEMQPRAYDSRVSTQRSASHLHQTLTLIVASSGLEITLGAVYARTKSAAIASAIDSISERVIHTPARYSIL